MIARHLRKDRVLAAARRREPRPARARRVRRLRDGGPRRSSASRSPSRRRRRSRAGFVGRVRRADRDAAPARSPACRRLPARVAAAHASTISRRSGSSRRALQEPHRAGRGARLGRALRWTAARAPISTPRSRAWSRSPASAPGPRTTSRCARCAGPTRSRAATSPCSHSLGGVTAVEADALSQRLAALAQLRRPPSVEQAALTRFPPWSSFERPAPLDEARNEPSCEPDCTEQQRRPARDGRASSCGCAQSARSRGPCRPAMRTRGS